jgi:hypothetical protein
VPLPSINSTVELIIDGALAHQCQIKDIAPDGLLTMVAPIGVGDLEPPKLGTALGLSWAEGRFHNLVQVRLTELTCDGLAHWRVRIDGEVLQENRRNYVRGACDDPVALERATALDPTSRAEGRALDVSEGGVRLWTPTCAYEAGESVRVRMDLNGEVVEAVGEVLRTHEGSRGSLGIDVVVTYELGESVAQVVRRYVIARQLAERRLRQYAQ